MAGSSKGPSFFMQKEYSQGKIHIPVSGVMHTSDKNGGEDRSGNRHTSTEIICLSSVNQITPAVSCISGRGNIYLYFFRGKSIKRTWKTHHKSHTVLGSFYFTETSTFVHTVLLQHWKLEYL